RSASPDTVRAPLDPALAMPTRVGADVFAIARRPGGSPMTVAVEKLQPTGFPLTVTLTDADSRMPTARLSDLPQVELLARVSASGDATPRAGDFESAPVVVENGAEVSAALMIDRVVE